jgi:hypothetical protein
MGMMGALKWFGVIGHHATNGEALLGNQSLKAPWAIKKLPTILGTSFIVSPKTNELATSDPELQSEA